MAAKKTSIYLYLEHDLANQINIAKSNNWISNLTSLSTHNKDELNDCFDRTGWNLDNHLHLKRFTPPKSSLIFHDKSSINSEFLINDRTYYTIFNLASSTSSLCYILMAITRNLTKQTVECGDSTCIFGDNFSHESDICDQCLSSQLNEKTCLDFLRIKILRTLITDKDSTLSSIGSNILNSVNRVSSSIRDHRFRNFLSSLIIDDLFGASKKNNDTRKWITDTANNVNNQKASLKKEYSISKKEDFKIPFLATSRHWNSWTPSQPRNNSTSEFKNTLPREKNILNSQGGGYLLSDGSNYVAIDPGFGFLQLLYDQHGITVCDIDAIVISHDHPDHSADLQRLLTLKHVYESTPPKKVKIFLNPSTFYIYKNILSYYSPLIYKGRPTRIQDGSTFRIGNMAFRAKQMYHSEIISFVNRIKSTPNCPLGFDIHGISNFGNFRVIIPGDTGFPYTDEELTKTANFYGPTDEESPDYSDIIHLDRRPDIAALHIGSLEENWKNLATVHTPSKEIIYKDNNHLGMLGIIRFANIIQPRVIAVSEYGEELDSCDIRLALNALIRKQLAYDPDSLIASDASLFLSMYKNNVYFKCSGVHEDTARVFVPVKQISLSINNSSFIKYTFGEGCPSGLLHYTLP